MPIVNYKGIQEDKLMKEVYGDYLEQQFIQTSPVFGNCKRIVGPMGREKVITFRGSVGAGLGSSPVGGNLPVASTNKQLKATLTTKRFYARVEFDREAIEASKTSVDAFVSLFKDQNDVAVSAFNIDKERQLIRNDIAGAGVLVTSSATPVTGNGTTTTPYVVDLADTDPLFMIEEGHLVNMGTETTALLVDAVDDVNKTISLVGTSSILATSAAGPTAIPSGVSRNVYMQGSKDAEWSGLLGVLSATSGTYKGETISRRWKATQFAHDASTPLTTALLNKVVIDIITKTGKKPNMILISPLQFELYINQLENQKRYNLPAANSKFKNQVSYEGIEFMSSMGPIPVMQSRFVPQAVAMILNTEYIELHMRHEFKWLDNDGSILGRREDKDSYEARYGGYSDLFINPHFQGIITNLKLTA